MERLLKMKALFSAHSDDGDVWAGSLLWYGLGNLTSAFTGLVINDSDSSKIGCFFSASQFVVGVIGTTAGIYGRHYGAF